MPDYLLEKQAGGVVCGVDEAGRGPWAGPVVAGAAILTPACLDADWAGGLDDSKKLGPARREKLFDILLGEALTGVGSASVAEIDSMNILQATLLAMARAVENLVRGHGLMPGLALVDGNRPPALACPAQCVVGGDRKSLSIAAASIIAKVSRDAMMADLARDYPQYGWDRNAGYGTAEHRRALADYGVTAHHRRSFAPIRRILEAQDMGGKIQDSAIS
jgi:ribonuclease HII